MKTFQLLYVSDVYTPNIAVRNYKAQTKYRFCSSKFKVTWPINDVTDPVTNTLYWSHFPWAEFSARNANFFCFLRPLSTNWSLNKEIFALKIPPGGKKPFIGTLSNTTWSRGSGSHEQIIFSNGVMLHWSLRWSETKKLKISIPDNIFFLYLIIIKLCTLKQLENIHQKLKLIIS